MAVYEWVKKFNSDIKGVTLNDQPDADDVMGVLDKVRKANGGGCKPAQVVAEAKKARSKIHGCFQWDDTEAAERYRCEQAKLLIRSISITVDLPDDGEVKVPALSSVRQEDGTRVYVSTTDAMSDRETQDQVLQHCLNSLVQWRRKWKALSELSEVSELIDAAIAGIREKVAVD